MEKNPHCSKVLTIDEFGGYSKFLDSKVQLDDLWTTDYNKMVREVAEDAEKEYGPLPDSQPKEKCLKRRRTEDYENLDGNILPGSDQISSLEEGDLFSPPKKPRRQRYCSDLTNITRSNQLKVQAQDYLPNPFLDDDIPSEKMGGFNFDSNDLDFPPKLMNSGNLFPWFFSNFVYLDSGFFFMEEDHHLQEGTNFGMEYTNF